ERADAAAGQALEGFGDPVLAAHLRPVLATALRTTDPTAWADLLRRGVHHAVPAGAGRPARLVWLKPALENARPTRHVTKDGDVRTYGVRFAAKSVSAEQSRSVTDAVAFGVLTALTLSSAVASAAVPGVPAVRGEAENAVVRGVHRTVIAGHSSMVAETTGFDADVVFRVYVDGQDGRTLRPVDRGLVADFPAAHSTADEPAPSLADPPPPAPTADARTAPPRLHRPVVHALDMTPVALDVQRRLLDARLGPDAVRSIMARLDILTEEVRQRGLTALGAGYSDRAVRVGSVLPGLGTDVRVTLRVTGVRLEYLGRTPPVKIREDLGVGSAFVSGRSGESSVSVTAGAGLMGLAAPAAHAPGHHAATSGQFPMALLTVGSKSSWHQKETVQTGRHTVLTTTEDEARYRAGLSVLVELSSQSHPRLSDVPRTVEVTADLGVPWWGGEGAAEFEEEALGQVRSPEVLWTLQHRPPAAAAPVADAPHVRRLLDVAGA
ncbi:hypothetical protein, partial [Streptomyces rubrogriseus]